MWACIEKWHLCMICAHCNDLITKLPQKKLGPFKDSSKKWLPSSPYPPPPLPPPYSTMSGSNVLSHSTLSVISHKLLAFNAMYSMQFSMADYKFQVITVYSNLKTLCYIKMPGKARHLNVRHHTKLFKVYNYTLSATQEQALDYYC